MYGNFFETQCSGPKSEASGYFAWVFYGLFTPSTWTRQNCLVLSAVVFTPPARQNNVICVVVTALVTSPKLSLRTSVTTSDVTCYFLRLLKIIESFGF